MKTKDSCLAIEFPGYSRDYLRSVKSTILENNLKECESGKKLAYYIEKIDDLKLSVQRLSTENDDMRLKLDVVEKFPALKTRTISSAAPGKKHEATALVLASDWHCEELITSEQASGLNEYNLDIFKDRSSWFFRNIVKLVEKESREVEIKNIVLGLIGDMISGSIHSDLEAHNQLGPMDAIALAQDTIAAGIRFLLANTKADITVVIKPGNHSRITIKQRVATETENALEWLMGHSLHSAFVDNPRVTFVRERGVLSYVDIYGYTVRFLHGHAFNYKGGVGGLSVPVLRKISEWDKGRKADLTCFGHLHTYFNGPNFMSNGSMIGYGPYSEFIGAAYEPPRQSFCLIDSLHGRTVQAPIFLHDPSKKP
jgi:uncharacterized membrane protein YeaQ/YmgE (transglycosylase-associated protein family)